MLLFLVFVNIKPCMLLFFSVGHKDIFFKNLQKTLSLKLLNSKTVHICSSQYEKNAMQTQCKKTVKYYKTQINMTPEVKVNVNDVWSKYIQETKMLEIIIDVHSEALT